jgi:hypothetical protein
MSYREDSSDADGPHARAVYGTVAAVVLVLVAGAYVAMLPSAAQKAEARYNFLEKRGSVAEACEAARAVRKIYADKGDATNYDRWKLSADVDCEEVSIYGGDAPADPEARAKSQATADAALNATDMNATDMSATTTDATDMNVMDPTASVANDAYANSDAGE